MASVIGITFGNTLSSIAVAKDGKVDVIANPDGDRLIPSVLSYVGVDEYHGAQARAQLIRHPNSTIVNFRDFLGKKFGEIDALRALSGAAPVESATGGVAYHIECDGKTETLSVEEVTVRHLKHLKRAAEDYLGQAVERAVVCVPTDFSEHQRAVLRECAAQAGVEVVQFANEPSAALLAYLSAGEDRFESDKVYVVADFGGVRLDAAVIAVRGGILTILSTLHEPQLGGEQLVRALSGYFAKEFAKKNKVDPLANARLVAKLHAESTAAIKTLSNVAQLSFSIESLAEGIDYLSNVNRLRFELVAREPLLRMVAFVEAAVHKAGLDVLDIDEVVLAGGVANVVKLASNLQFLFGDKTTVYAPALDSRALNPEELATRGAALQAALVEGFDADEVAELLQAVVVNTQHLSAPIGLKDAAGVFHAILVAETAYPIKKLFEVTNGDASSVAVELYEGERTVKETVLEREPDSDSEDEPDVEREVVYVAGKKLALLALADLKPHAKIEVIVNIKENGVLHVTGRELKQGAAAVTGEIKQA